MGLAGGRDSGSDRLVKGRVAEVVSQQRLGRVGDSCRHGGPGGGEPVLGNGAPIRVVGPTSVLRVQDVTCPV